MPNKSNEIENPAKLQNSQQIAWPVLIGQLATVGMAVSDVR